MSLGRVIHHVQGQLSEIQNLSGIANEKILLLSIIPVFLFGCMDSMHSETNAYGKKVWTRLKNIKQSMFLKKNKK